jgi:hypothetical protein
MLSKIKCFNIMFGHVFCLLFFVSLEFRSSTTNFFDGFSGDCVGNAEGFPVLDLEVLSGLEVCFNGVVVVVGGVEVVMGWR